MSSAHSHHRNLPVAANEIPHNSALEFLYTKLK
jgi:hypothetical protein